MNDGGSEEFKMSLLSAAMGMGGPADDQLTSLAILQELERAEKNFPERLSHHTAIRDSSIALASFTQDEARQVEAYMHILRIFEEAARYKFEAEQDYTLYQDFTNEVIYFKKLLSLGRGVLLEVLKTSMRIIDVGKNVAQKEEQKKRGLFWRW